jgi:hypothetical protein
MDNAIIGNIDIYELTYKDIILSIKNNIQNISVSDDTNKYVLNTCKELVSVKSKYIKITRFSDIIYEKFPIAGNVKNTIEYEYIPMFIDKNINGSVNKHIERFRCFNINNLPLIDVAKYLNIKVEKSNQIKSFGMYIPYEKKIIMGSDYEPVFIHELVHGVDHILPNYIYEENYTELVAELSTIVLCKIYSVPIDISYAMFYLDSYTVDQINHKELIIRVSKIVEYIKYCKEHIKNKNNGT